MVGLTLYKTNSVATLSPGQLVVRLYEGAIRNLKLAIQELEAGRYMEKGQYINKALAILEELDCTLKMDEGGEVAANLHSLYGFMTRHLIEANSQKSPQKIQEVIALLSEVNEGWKAIAD